MGQPRNAERLTAHHTSEIPQHASQLRRGDRSGTSFARLLASSWQPGFRADVWSGVGDEDPTRQTAGRRYRHVLIGGGPGARKPTQAASMTDAIERRFGDG